MILDFDDSLIPTIPTDRPDCQLDLSASKLPQLQFKQTTIPKIETVRNDNPRTQLVVANPPRKTPSHVLQQQSLSSFFSPIKKAKSQNESSGELVQKIPAAENSTVNTKSSWSLIYKPLSMNKDERARIDVALSYLSSAEKRQYWESAANAPRCTGHGLVVEIQKSSSLLGFQQYCALQNALGLISGGNSGHVAAVMGTRWIRDRVADSSSGFDR